MGRVLLSSRRRYRFLTAVSVGGAAPPPSRREAWYDPRLTCGQVGVAIALGDGSGGACSSHVRWEQLLAFPSREGGTVGDGRVEANYGFTIFELRIKVSFHKVTLPKDALILLLTFVGLMWVLLFRLVPRHLPRWGRLSEPPSAREVARRRYSTRLRENKPFAVTEGVHVPNASLSCTI